MRYVKRMTVKDWKSFDRIESGSVLGNDMKFFNFFTQKYEAFDYVTRQELLLRRYKIILTNYRDRKYVKTRYPNDRIRMIKVGEACPTPLKEKLILGVKSMPSKMTGENLNKGFKKFDKFMSNFEKGMSSFSKGLGGNNDPNFWYGNKSKIDWVSKSSNNNSMMSSKNPFVTEKKKSKRKSKKRDTDKNNSLRLKKSKL